MWNGIAEVPVVSLSWHAEFSAAHRVYSVHLSDEENRQLFGDCGLPNFHGHNYTVVVTVRGPVDPRTGMVIDLAVIKQRLAAVLKLLDHRNLNLDVKEFQDGSLPATAENIAIWVWHRLQRELGPYGRLLDGVRVGETPKIFAEYRGHTAKL